MTEKMTQAEHLAKTARTNKVRLVADVVMIASFILMFFTSIAKFPIPSSWFDYLEAHGLFSLITFSLLSYIHDFSGVVFILALFTHLWLNWKRLQWLIKAALK